MGSTLAQLRASLRQELRDEDTAAYTWPDTILDRHLQRAIAETQAAAPTIVSIIATMPNPASPRLNLSSLISESAHLWFDAIEYPLDCYPRQWLPFREEPSRVMFLLAEEVPASGEDIRVWYARPFTVSAGSSDMPTEYDPMVLDGAAVFALTDQAVDLAPKLVGRDAPALYEALAEARAARFSAALAALRLRSATPMWRPSWRLPR
ncbi:MAG: hypothetical protein EPO26_10840 [Chloroflexota bacterium]|nr:MAG: hypothetical protein EPO26_10840 [Chloroflexota bacterium]